MRRKSLMCAALAAAILATSNTGALAQTIDADIPETGVGGSFFVRDSYGHRFDTDMDDVRGEFSTHDARIELGGTVDFGNVRWANAVGYGFTAYDANLVDADVHSLMLASIVDFDVAPQWSMMVGPVVGMNAETDADWEDSLSYGALLGTAYRPSKELTLGFALVAMRRIEEGVGLTPIPMVKWTFAPNWQLYTGLTEVAARRGLGGYVGWSFAECWEAAAGLQFERRRFRLDTADAIGEDKSAPAYVRISWEILEGLKLEAMTGITFGGRFKVNDKDDHFRAGSDYDPAPFVGVRLGYAIASL